MDGSGRKTSAIISSEISVLCDKSHRLMTVVISAETLVTICRNY
ncbi:hypothetical protein LINPERHAP1_LOCUS36520, partial [Linum perenne]